MREFKQIAGFQKYYINKNGDVYSEKSNKLLAKWVDRDGYNLVCLNGKTYRVCRLMLKTFVGESKQLTNHKNSVRHDDRLLNLEYVNHRENSVHGLLKKKRSSKYIGVTYDKRCKKWRARIWFNGVRIHLGLFFNEFDAHKSYIDFVTDNNISLKYGVINGAK